MEAGTILSADVLDIIFDNRNKDYGAYDLRKHYQQRMVKSLLGMFLIVILLLITYMLVAAIKPATNKLIDQGGVVLIKVSDKIEQPVVQLPVKQPVVDVKTKMFTKFVIAQDNKVNKDDQPPEQTELTDAKIGTANIDGAADIGIEGPVDKAKDIIDAPKKMDDDGVVIGVVEIESQYPGGFEAWKAYLNRNLTYPQDAIDIAIEGTVYVQFIVDKEGNVSDVTAINGPEQLRKAAVAAIKKSGKWTAAIQNGRKVKSYKKQPITFKLAEDQ